MKRKRDAAVLCFVNRSTWSSCQLHILLLVMVTEEAFQTLTWRTHLQLGIRAAKESLILQDINLEVPGVTAQQLHIHQESVESTWHLLPEVGLCPCGIQQTEFGQNKWVELTALPLHRL